MWAEVPGPEAQAFREERGAAAARSSHSVSAMSILSPDLKGCPLVGQQLPGKPAFHARWQRRFCIVVGGRNLHHAPGSSTGGEAP